MFPVNAFDTGRSYLSLKNSKISAKYLIDVLKRCPLLTRLDVTGCFPVDDDVISDILDLCPLIQNLCIRNCRKLTDAALVCIQKKSKCINILNIGGNINMTETGLQHFIINYPHAHSLQELHVSGLPLTPEVLGVVAKQCSSLRSLSLGYAIVTPETFKGFMEKIGDGLEYLSLAWAESVLQQDIGGGDNNSSLVDLVRQNCAQLVSLDLTGVKNVNSAALNQLIDYKYSQVSNLCFTTILLYYLSGIFYLLILCHRLSCMYCSFKTEKFPGEWKGLEHIKIKFLPITKQQLEQLRVSYPDIQFEQ